MQFEENINATVKRQKKHEGLNLEVKENWNLQDPVQKMVTSLEYVKSFGDINMN